MRFSTSALALAALVALAACGEADDGGLAPEESVLFAEVRNETVSEDLDAFDNRGAWIDHYAAYATACVDKVDDLDGKRTLFHGCWDWHSSVHAHWAVLRADLTGDGRSRAGARKIDGRLTAEALERVRAELAAEPSYEMPYGRAWLLRLASEHETWARARETSDPTRLRALGAFAAASLVSYYERNAPDPRSPDYKNDSWSMAQLAAWYRHVGDERGLAKVRGWVETRFVNAGMRWESRVETNPERFFSTWWSWAYAILAALDADAALQAIDVDRIDPSALIPAEDPGRSTSEVHHIGINWSRAWAIKALARRVAEARGAESARAKELARAYQLHVQEGRKRHERYRGDYHAYDHWVPQFAIYAITR